MSHPPGCSLAHVSSERLPSIFTPEGKIMGEGAQEDSWTKALCVSN